MVLLHTNGGQEGVASRGPGCASLLWSTRINFGVRCLVTGMVFHVCYCESELDFWQQIIYFLVFIHLYYIYPCAYLCRVHIEQEETRKGGQISGAQVRQLRAQSRYRGKNLCSLQEQPVFLSTKSFLQAYIT